MGQFAPAEILSLLQKQFGCVGLNERASSELENEMLRTTVLLLLLFAGLSLMTTLTFAFGPLRLDSFLSTAPPI